MLRVPADYSYFTAEKRVIPQYPPEALQAKISGDVILAVLYSTRGEVTWCGRILGDPILVKTAMQAVAQWKFKPIKEQGKEIRGITYVGFDFHASEARILTYFPFGIWEESPESTLTSGKPAVARVRVRSGVVAGTKVGGPNPVYPATAKHDRVQGAVVLRAVIDKQGHISMLQVMQSPREDLSISSIEAVKKWQYKPYTLEGQAVEVETTITVNYTLRG